MEGQSDSDTVAVNSETSEWMDRSDVTTVAVASAD